MHERIETRIEAHGKLRGLVNGEASYAEPLARYLLDGGLIHWRNAANAVDALDPERDEYEDCRDLVAAIRCALANADSSGLRYFFG